jgi:DNA adenine methylase
MAVAVETFAQPAATPPLKWAGGKRWLVPDLWRYWAKEEHRRLVEPFVGGMAVTLGLAPRSALLNDVNPHVIIFYKWLQRGLPVPQGMFKRSPEVFWKHRERFHALIAAGEADSAEAALLFYYLNRTCYNGLCRFNSKGFFNVPFGRYKAINYRESFGEYPSVLRDWSLVTGDFENLRVRKTDFIYADPPYDVEFTSYAAEGFSWADQERLAKWLASHSGPVVASNQATSRIKRLYKKLGFAVRTLAAPRRISCDGNRDDAREMLATLNL